MEVGKQGTWLPLCEQRHAGLVSRKIGFSFRFDFRSSLEDWDKTNAEMLKS
jgi:hypothetical protein